MATSGPNPPRHQLDPAAAEPRLSPPPELAHLTALHLIHASIGATDGFEIFPKSPFVTPPQGNRGSGINFLKFSGKMADFERKMVFEPLLSSGKGVPVKFLWVSRARRRPSVSHPFGRRGPPEPPRRPARSPAQPRFMAPTLHPKTLRPQSRL